MREERPLQEAGGGAPAPGAPPVPLAAVDPGAAAYRPTGLAELDRVLGDGLVPGSVTLLGGEPGIGKSTLVLQALATMAESGARCLLVCAEESKEQVRLRAERLGALHPNLLVVADPALEHIATWVDETSPDVLAIDSIQAISSAEVSGPPGSVAQVRACAARLVALAKERTLATLIVGHVTKDGAIAGPRALEHVVDTVLAFEGDRHHALRMVRALKHRFGATHELGLFEMGHEGLVPVPDPSALFLADRRTGLSGTVVAPILEGARPVLVEVQALVTRSYAEAPQRSVQGLDAKRLTMLLAVLASRAGLSAGRCDVFASVTGGIRVRDPGIDLALAIALASAQWGVAIAHDVVAIGEIGLGGEVRQVPQTARRLEESGRLGYRLAVVPPSAPEVPGIALHRVSTLEETLAAVHPVAGTGSGQGRPDGALTLVS
jgi:DNA repair protein RadA/Sms